MSQSIPLVSVIIPTYNQANYLKEALINVTQQTISNIEVIIVNNFSEDHTLEVIKEYQDPRIKVINFKNNGCIAASRNQGIQAAQGKYLAFLDSDDIWYKNKLELALEKLKEGYQFYCHSQIFFYEGENKEIVHIYGPIENTQFPNLLFRNNPISTSTVVVEAQLVKEQGGFTEDPKAITAEDYDLWLQLSEQETKIYLSEEVLGKKRVHDSNYSNSVVKHINATLFVINAHLAKLKPLSMFYHFLYRKKKAVVIYGGARTLQVGKNYPMALSYYLKSLLVFPLSIRPFAGMVQLFFHWLRQIIRPHNKKIQAN